MSRPRQTAQDPALPSTPRTPRTPRTPTSMATRQSARIATEDYRLTTPRAPRTPTRPPILHDPTSPTPMVLRRSRREKALPPLAQSIMGSALQSDQDAPEQTPSVNGVDVREEGEVELELRRLSSVDPVSPAQPRLVVSIPIGFTNPKRPLDDRTDFTQDMHHKHRRLDRAFRSHAQTRAMSLNVGAKDLREATEDIGMKDQVMEEHSVVDSPSVQSSQDKGLVHSNNSNSTYRKEELIPEEQVKVNSTITDQSSKARMTSPSQASLGVVPRQIRPLPARQAHGNQIKPDEREVMNEQANHGEQTEIPAPGDHEDEGEDIAHDLESDEEDGYTSAAVSEYILREMLEFEQGFNGLQGKYKLLDKIGAGTFSSVYKAIDLEHDQYDNSDWDYGMGKQLHAKEIDSSATGNHSTISSTTTAAESSTRDGGKVVALKRIYVTSSPRRIENEISILHDLSGHKNVVPLVTAFRFRDQVIVVLPYFEHRDFRDYYRDLPMEDIRCYFRALLKGLMHVHARGIIHRDVKPSNFLYDTEARTGVLVDFGLAQRQEEKPQKLAGTPATSASKTSNSVGASKGEVPNTNTTSSQPFTKNSAPMSTKSSVERQVTYAPKHVSISSSTSASNTVPHQISSTKETPGATSPSSNHRVTSVPGATAHSLSGLPPSQMPNLVNHVRPKDPTMAGAQIPNNPQTSVLMANRQPGLLRKDTRPVLRVNRAGTRGFRAPEVLFKHIRQTVALDIWSVGVILIAFLTGRFPFFNSNDDVEALLEIAVLFGDREMKKVAATFDRNFITNIPTIKEHPISLLRICRVLNPKRFTPPEGYVSKSSSSQESTRGLVNGSSQASSQVLSLERQQPQVATSAGPRDSHHGGTLENRQIRRHSTISTADNQTTAGSADVAAVTSHSSSHRDQARPATAATVSTPGSGSDAREINTSVVPLRQLLPDIDRGDSPRERQTEESDNTARKTADAHGTNLEKLDANNKKTAAASSSSSSGRADQATRTSSEKRKKQVVVGTDSQQDLEVAVQLLERLLALDPRKRITAEQALKHPFLLQKHER